MTLDVKLVWELVLIVQVVMLQIIECLRVTNVLVRIIFMRMLLYCVLHVTRLAILALMLILVRLVSVVLGW